MRRWLGDRSAAFHIVLWLVVHGGAYTVGWLVNEHYGSTVLRVIAAALIVVGYVWDFVKKQRARGNSTAVIAVD